MRGLCVCVHLQRPDTTPRTRAKPLLQMEPWTPAGSAKTRRHRQKNRATRIPAAAEPLRLAAAGDHKKMNKRRQFASNIITAFVADQTVRPTHLGPRQLLVTPCALRRQQRDAVMDRASCDDLGSRWAVRRHLLRMYIRLQPRKSEVRSSWTIGCQLESLQPRDQL